MIFLKKLTKEELSFDTRVVTVVPEYIIFLPYLKIVSYGEKDLKLRISYAKVNGME